jgi:hypothetical protein
VRGRSVGRVKELTQVDATARHRNVESAGAHHRRRIENEAQKTLLQRLLLDRLDQKFVHAEPRRCGDARLCNPTSVSMMTGRFGLG